MEKVVLRMYFAQTVTLFGFKMNNDEKVNVYLVTGTCPEKTLGFYHLDLQASTPKHEERAVPRRMDSHLSDQTLASHGKATSPE